MAELNAEDVRPFSLDDVIRAARDWRWSDEAIGGMMRRWLRETDDHEPDNERGVWCCQEHREAFHARRLNDGQVCGR